MTDKRIQQATEWANSRCKDDPKCIATHGHKGPHRGMSKTWPRKVAEAIGGSDEK